MSTVNISLNVVSTPSTSIIFTPIGQDGSGNYEGPLAAGTVLGSFVIAPPQWAGVITLAGDATPPNFAVQGLQLVTAQVVAVGAYNLSASATP